MGNKPIVHAPIATGSTEPRDIRDRFADFVNLKDFGAVGDGIADDSAAWAAWKAALQNGGMPYIPKGDYYVGSETIHVPKGHFGTNTKAFSFEDNGLVLRQFSFSVYVAENGNDDNDGLTRATAVATISRALQISNMVCPAASGRDVIIKLYGGTYTEANNIVVSGTRLQILLYGSATINVPVVASYGGGLIAIDDVSGNNATLTINGTLYFEDNSVFSCNCTLNIYSTLNGGYTLTFLSGSVFHCTASVILTATGSGCRFVHSYMFGRIVSLTFASIFSSYGSDLYVSETFTLNKTGNNANSTAYIQDGSRCYFHDWIVKGVFNSSAAIINIGIGSSCSVDNLTCEKTSGTVSRAVFVNSNSSMYVVSYYKVSGAFSGIVTNAMENSMFTLPSTATVVNNATGQRHYADRGAQINLSNVSNKNQRLPGSTDGSAHANSFGFVQ